MNIEHETINNKHFRNVVYTGKYMQIVLMSLKPLQVIPREVHYDHDQFIRIEKGIGRIIITSKENPLEIINSLELRDGSAVVIAAGQYHEIQNIDKTSDLQLYTIYSPPEHEDKIIQDMVDDKLIKIGGFNKYKYDKYLIKCKNIVNY
jgi:mannose-6-phosphate isomerase-like protein (cupin superfamily)